LIISLIPARSGSRGVPGKNVKPLAGYPLIAYSIIVSRLSSRIERTIVTTDSREFAEIAIAYGAEVPFLRPREIAQDGSLDIEYVKHALGWLKTHEAVQPEYLVILPPPTPLRDPALIDKAIDKIMQNEEATSLRSACETRESPYKLFGIENDYYVGLFPDDPRPEYYNLPRQAFPPVYHPNGYVDIVKSQTVTNLGTLHGPRILSFITPDVGEVDRPEDFDFIEFLLSKQKNPVYEHLKNNFPAREIENDKIYVQS
jgi:CMP-N-acetylneuraminic acid synthetase